MRPIIPDNPKYSLVPHNQMSLQCNEKINGNSSLSFSSIILTYTVESTDSLDWLG